MYDIRIYLIFVHLARKQLCKNQHGEMRGKRIRK